MLGIDIFNNDAFSTVELTAALEDIPYQPTLLEDMGIFTERPIRTTSVAIEQREGELRLIPVTPRGAPLPQLTVKPSDMRNFNTVRVAKGDRLNASELQNIRAFGTQTELLQVQAEVARRLQMLRNDMRLTHEHMRLGALQGKLLDADGQVLYNFFTEFQIPEPAVINFKLSEANPGRAALRGRLRTLKRAMFKNARGNWTNGTTIIAFCGDDFWDRLISHAEVEKPYEIAQQGEALRSADVWTTFRFGGIDWINYQGTDPEAGNAPQVGIASDECLFCIRGLPGLYLRVNAPGESEEWVNTLGQPEYALTIPDRDRRFFTDIELYSYPLYMPTRPRLIQKGKAD